MTEHELHPILERLHTRSGVRALLGMLGFVGELQPAPRPHALPAAVRTLHVSWRTTLCAYVIRMRGRCERSELSRIASVLRAVDPVAHQLLVVVEPRGHRMTLACDALHDGLRFLTLDMSDLRASDVEAVGELMPHGDEDDTAAAVRITRALDRTHVGRRFFRDVTGCRQMIARSWSGLPPDASEERDALALLLISRLMFLYFLQRRGLLAGDLQFMTNLFGTTLRAARRRTFYATSLRTLFFGVLNRRPEQRSAAARALGELPYLNGGLFERHAMERRRPKLDLADDVIGRVLHGVLEKYRFTATDSPDSTTSGGIDPEMLGRLFERLMPGATRTRTGTFYTPAPLVAHVASTVFTEHIALAAEAPRSTVAQLIDGDTNAASADERQRIVDAAARVRVLDPACGSGAFLLGALETLTRLRAADDRPASLVEQRRRTVADSLYGVDLLADAALICSLRMWLSLVPACEDINDVPPLPNLDRRLRQGDALIDPLDVHGRQTPRSLQPLLRALAPAAREYLHAEPAQRKDLRRTLTAIERRLARAWLDSMTGSLEDEARELRARSGDADLFGDPTTSAVSARSRLPAIRRRASEVDAYRRDISSARGLPFFSFRVHFAEVSDGFDVILSNPPWVRSHHWPKAVREVLRERYTVCARAGWPASGAGNAASGQVDLSLLFLEQAVRLLAPAGTLGVLLPAKLIRSLYPGGARELLLRSMSLLVIEDHGLDHRATFEADAFTAVLVARRADNDSERAGAAAEVCMTRAGLPPLRFHVRADDLPLRPGDERSPWLLAPPACAAAVRAMQAKAPTIGAQGLVVRRGAMTGANDIMLLRDVEHKLGGLTRVRCDGYYRDGADRRRFSGLVETSVVRPALRGTDVNAWTTRTERHVIWSPANDDPDAALPPRLEAFLRRAWAGDDRTDGTRSGRLHRLNEFTLGHKVVWSDLASDLRAAAVEPGRTVAGSSGVPLVPLNTVYFLATRSLRESMIMAAYLNSLPVRTFARSIAERAKDAHFRFFAWTIGALPLPETWREGPAADALLDISSRAHERGHLDSSERSLLDRLVGEQYGLDADALNGLATFDAWLAGRPSV